MSTTSTGDPLKTVLHSWHAAQGGKLVEFGGWLMPVHYGSIVEEHHACRQRAALFDVSHMGRLQFNGPGTAAFLDSLLTRKITNAAVGQVRYSLLCREDGGILDDVLHYSLVDEHQQPYSLLVVNASNRAKIVAWIQSRLPPTITLRDLTLETSMIAVQGPQAISLLQPYFAETLADCGYYTARNTPQGLVSRTGYTGEDGCELILPNEHAVSL